MGLEVIGVDVVDLRPDSSVSNQPPPAGLHFAGEAEIDGATEQITPRILVLAGELLLEGVVTP